MPMEDCKHDLIHVEFDQEAARTLPAEKVRELWPRFFGICPDCEHYVTKYASFTHYLYGDW